MKLDRTLVSEVKMYAKAIPVFKYQLSHLKASKRIFFYSKVHLMDTLLKNLKRSLHPRKDITFIRDIYEDIRTTYIKV